MKTNPLKKAENKITDKVVIKNNVIKSKIQYDYDTLKTIHEIAVSVGKNADVLKVLSQTLSHERIDVTAIKINTKKL